MPIDNTFEILVQEYHEMVFGYLLAITNDPHTAEDLTQEAFIVAYRRFRDYDKSRDFGAWIRGIARRLALAEFRHSRRFAFVRLEEVERALCQELSEQGEAASSLWQRRMDALRLCLNKVDEMLRNVLRLYYFDQLKSSEIAERLELGVEAVWKRLSRGRQALRQCVDREMGREDRS